MYVVVKYVSENRGTENAFCFNVFTVDFEFKYLQVHRGHSFSTFVKFHEKLTLLIPDLHMYVCGEGLRNVSFRNILETH